MRKILSQGKSKSKERFNQLIVGIVLMFIMFLSVVGYSLSGRDSEDKGTEKVSYNGYEFKQQGGYWTINIEDLEFIFRYNPEEVRKIPGNLKYINDYYDLPLYIQSENSDATVEIYMNLNPLVQRMQPACLNESECEGDYPIKDCTSNFIIIKESNITKIEQNQSCVFIQGKEEDLVEIADEFLFKIIGIEE